MQPQHAGLWVVAKGRRVVGAHLEKDAHLKLAEALPGEKPIHIVVRIHGRDNVDASARSFIDEFLKLRSDVPRLVAVIHRETKVLVLSKLFEILQAMNEHK